MTHDSPNATEARLLEKIKQAGGIIEYLSNLNHVDGQIATYLRRYIQSVKMDYATYEQAARLMTKLEQAW